MKNFSIMKNQFFVNILTSRWAEIVFVNLLLFSSAFAQTMNGIQGKFLPTDTWSDTVYLCEIRKISDFFNGSNFLVVDTCPIAEDGSFFFDTERLMEQKKFYRLNFAENGGNPGGITVGFDKENFIFLLLHKGSKVNLAVDGNNISQLYEVQGSQENEQIKEMTNLLAERQKLGTEIHRAVEIARNSNSPTVLDSMIRQFTETILRQFEKDKTALKAFAERSKFPELALLAAMYMEFSDDLKNDLTWYEELNKRLEKELPDSDYAKQFAREIEEFKTVLPVGTPAPEIELPGINGDTIRLSGIKSKLLLVDFWASWCSPCRQENRETVLPLYQKYHEQGFEVLGVSLDTKREKWLKAIESDQLPWIHVSDLRGFNNCPAAQAYKIKALPTTYLVDENGNILAKNLRGLELKHFVEERF